MLIPVVKSSWWQIADEDYDAGAYSNKPAAGAPTERYHQQVSDFTIFKAANGKWQLISAVRHTHFREGHHFLMRWEADSLTQSLWEEKGILLTTDDFPPAANYKTGVFYAPHVIKEKGRYHMFHNSSNTAHMLISADGIKYAPDNEKLSHYNIFDPGLAGRDLMVMDNRERDGLWYVYYVNIDSSKTALKDRQYQDVYARTSSSLYGPWSEEIQVGLGTANRSRSNPSSPYDFVNAESPFVVHKDGWYYKFEQSNVVASLDPADFEGKPVVTSILPGYDYHEKFWPVLAPEIILDGERMFIAFFMNHHEHPLKGLKQGGVFLAELDWVEN